MIIRAYDPENDLDAARRIWMECGWLEKENFDAFDDFSGAATGLVGELNGEAETLVLNFPGTIRHLETDLPLCVVGSVNTSRVARKQGLAGRVTAQAIARDAAPGSECGGGALVAALGMFEQGYYNRLGFGTLEYDRELKFDPSTLRLPDGVRARPPQRLGPDDFEKIHANRLGRRRGHGACSVTSVGHTKGEMIWEKKGFGLGWFDGPDGELSHHLWCRPLDDEEFGPYRVKWMAYTTNEQLLELLALLRNLGDQVQSVRMFEPPGIMLQDLLDQPMRIRSITQRSKLEQDFHFLAWQQARMLDVIGCLEKTKMPGAGHETVRFNLELHDPIETLLPDDAPSDSWWGVSGSYIVTLGSSCGAEKGRDNDLLTLESSVNAFTRLWLGVRPASGLTMTEHFKGPRELIEKLDDVIRLPRPDVDWHF